MSRWIDIDDDRNCYIGNDGEYERWNIDPDVLDEAILTADAVRVVLCKDCKHNGGRPIGGDRYWCKLHDSYMQFCSDAKKRTGQ